VTLGILSLIASYSPVQVAVDHDPSESAAWDDALRLLLGLRGQSGAGDDMFPRVLRIVRRR
jgi:hypothetical protein